MEEKICPGCGEKVPCGPLQGRDHCWCSDFPRVMGVPEVGAGCFCPRCLAMEILARRGGPESRGEQS